MYLLHTTKLTLKSFYAEIPEYAILSHTWGEKEVTFQDIQSRDKDKSDRKMSGDVSDREVSGDKSEKEVSEDKSDTRVVFGDEPRSEVPGDDSDKDDDREMSGDDSDREVSGEESDMEDSDLDDESDGRELVEAAWKKVEGACAHAKKYGWKWIWIDSCCIDKSSSAELSENINSMYRLYENALVCYVYLSDASSEEDPRNPESGFAKSRWFTRGWTLQELIAPSASVVFLDHLWEEIGTRYSLRDVISAITSIPVQLLEDGDLTKYSIAQKMSWAAFRKTTRSEDRAYSLMGLFDICMPPIYGEGGTKAFMRLQQEIIKTSDDRSIFAWVVDRRRKWDGGVIECEPRGLLARSPDEFKASGRVGISAANFPNDTSSFSFNNNGLHIHFPIFPIDDMIRASLKCQVDEDKCDIVRASLNCQVDNSGDVCNIYLRKTTDRHYVRYRPDQLVLRSFETPENVQEVIVKEIPPSRQTRKVYDDLRNNKVHLLPAAEEHFENTAWIEDAGRARSVSPFEVSSWRPFTVKFDCRHSDETVHISFAASKQGGGILWMASSNSLKMGFVEGACYADRLTMELGSGGFVTATVHITERTAYREKTREIEINYTTSSLIPTLRCSQSQFIEIPDDSLRDVFPPNQSDRGPSDDRPPRRYLSLSKEASGACRIFDYHFDKIAIGIKESGEVWVHVLGPWDIRSETSKEIWESYQENGSRVQSKGNTSCEFGYRTATVYKNDGLQFASHSLIITSTW